MDADVLTTICDDPMGILTLMLVVANFVHYKMMQKDLKND